MYKSKDPPSYSLETTGGGGVPTSGGYELDFLDDPVPDEYQCPICLMVMRDPLLTSCCGSHYCEICIVPLAKGGKPCPKCQEQFSTLLNKHHRRKILELKAYCKNRKHGCDWSGTLYDIDQHVKTHCLFSETKCNACGDLVLRHEVELHLGELCPMRIHTCQYCRLEDTYDYITKEHAEVCPSYPVLCPNRCNIGSVDRCCLEQHLCVCVLQPLDCDFRHAGCTTRVLRKDVGKHMSENVQEHLLLLSSLTCYLSKELDAKDQQVTALKKTLKKREEQIKALSKTVADLCKLVPTPPMEVTLDNFRVLKMTSIAWNSPHFYSHSNGYKLCLKVLPNGFSIGRNYYISVLLCLMKGEFDNQLEWPYEGSAVIQLLNQHGGYDKELEGHCSEELMFSFPRVHNKAIGGGYGFPTFIPHSNLGYRFEKGTEFLKHDRLVFRVASITPCHNRECTTNSMARTEWYYDTGTILESGKS